MKKALKIIAILFVIAIIIGFVLFTINFIKTKSLDFQRMLETKEVVHIEYGDELPSIKVYFEEFYDYDENDFTIEYSKEIPLNEEGKTINEAEVTVTIKNEKKEFQSKLKIKDKTNPELVLKVVSKKEGTDLKVEEFIESCFDLSGECTYEFSGVISMSVGTHEIKIKATDKHGNKTTIATTLTIVAKTTSIPTISCNKTIRSDLSDYIFTYEMTCEDINNGKTENYDTKAQNKMNSEIATASNRSDWGDAGVVYVVGAYDAIYNTNSQIIGYMVAIGLTDASGNILADYAIDVNGNKVWEENTIGIN